jgi:hypothetical protein
LFFLYFRYIFASLYNPNPVEEKKKKEEKGDKELAGNTPNSVMPLRPNLLQYLHAQAPGQPSDRAGK